MITEEDIKKLSGVLATKDDFGSFTKSSNEQFIKIDQNFNRLVGEIVTIKQDVTTFKEELAALKETTQALVVAVDGLAKAVKDFRQEYAMLILATKRHEQWILQMADKIGLKLES